MTLTLTVIHGIPDPVLASFRPGKEYTVTDVSNRTKITDEGKVRAQLDRLCEAGRVIKSKVSTGSGVLLVWKLP